MIVRSIDFFQFYKIYIHVFKGRYKYWTNFLDPISYMTLKIDLSHAFFFYQSWPWTVKNSHQNNRPAPFPDISAIIWFIPSTLDALHNSKVGITPREELNVLALARSNHTCTKRHNVKSNFLHMDYKALDQEIKIICTWKCRWNGQRFLRIIWPQFYE